MNDLTDAELHEYAAAVNHELLARAIASGDPDVLVREAMQSMFGPSGEPNAPYLINPTTLAIAGSVIDTTATKHSCKLYTVRPPDGDAEHWCWEDSGPTFIHGDSDKVGKTRRSVNLHVALEDLVVIKHTMTWNGERHVRNATTAYKVHVTADEETGELTGGRVEMLTDWTPSHLPPPHSENDTRSYGGRAR